MFAGWLPRMRRARTDVAGRAHVAGRGYYVAVNFAPVLLTAVLSPVPSKCKIRISTKVLSK